MDETNSINVHKKPFLDHQTRCLCVTRNTLSPPRRPISVTSLLLPHAPLQRSRPSQHNHQTHEPTQNTKPATRCTSSRISTNASTVFGPTRAPVVSSRSFVRRLRGIHIDVAFSYCLRSYRTAQNVTSFSIASSVLLHTRQCAVQLSLYSMAYSSTAERQIMAEGIGITGLQSENRHGHSPMGTAARPESLFNSSLAPHFIFNGSSFDIDLDSEDGGSTFIAPGILSSGDVGIDSPG